MFLNWKRKERWNWNNKKTPASQPMIVVVWSENNIPELSCDASSRALQRPLRIENEILSIDHRSWYFFCVTFVGSSRGRWWLSFEVGCNLRDAFFQLKNCHSLKCLFLVFVFSSVFSILVLSHNFVWMWFEEFLWCFTITMMWWWWWCFWNSCQSRKRNVNSQLTLMSAVKCWICWKISIFFSLILKRKNHHIKHQVVLHLFQETGNWQWQWLMLTSSSNRISYLYFFWPVKLSSQKNQQKICRVFSNRFNGVLMTTTS